jgi:NTE family protein
MARVLDSGLRLAALLAIALLAACSTARPWLNAPIGPPAAAGAGRAVDPTQPVADRASGSPTVIAAVALSGGGARAAAFGLGVLEELKATPIDLDGRPSTLLDEVALISGVSGGSVLATYYAAFGDEVFSRFDADFLQRDFQAGLIQYILSPVSQYRLTSPWYGRSNALAEQLDPVFRGLTFGDLRDPAGGGKGPRLLVTATDLTTGAPFEFTPEQFALICSDLDSVPLSFAVAASSSVPVLLSPMTIRNYAGSCPPPAQTQEAPPSDPNLSARLRRMIATSYGNAQERPYLHLVDGGVVDNLGVRGLLDQMIARGSLRQSFAHLPPASVRRIVLVSVNSERDLGERLDDSDRVPSSGQVLDALVFGAGSRSTTETGLMVADAARRLATELAAERGSDGSPFAADAELHVISVSLRDVPDAALRRQLLQVPTAFTILPLQVKQLREAGRSALRASPDYQALLRGLQAPGASVTADSAGTS